MSSDAPAPADHRGADGGATRLPDASDRVHIHYRRLPGRTTVYDQRIVHQGSDVIVTLAEPALLRDPMIHDGEVMLEPGSRVVWFTFPDTWHDIGRFHDAEGRFTGIYANILTPPVLDGPIWHTTDLFLDVWWPLGGEITVLDEDELEEALAAGHIEERLAGRARAEAERMLRRARSGTWPPPVVDRWTLERALR